LYSINSGSGSYLLWWRADGVSFVLLVCSAPPSPLRSWSRRDAVPITCRRLRWAMAESGWWRC